MHALPLSKKDNAMLRYSCFVKSQTICIICSHCAIPRVTRSELRQVIDIKVSAVFNLDDDRVQTLCVGAGGGVCSLTIGNGCVGSSSQPGRTLQALFLNASSEKFWQLLHALVMVIVDWPWLGQWSVNGK